MSTLRPYQAKAEKEIFEAWANGYKNVMYQLVTGGGKTVLFVNIIKKFIIKKKRVMLIAHREELITQAWNHLYKNQILAGIIKADVPPNFSLPCQVASIQTLARRSNIPTPDLIIIDEAHHSQEDNTYGRILANVFPGAYVLFVTATPYRLNGDGFTDICDKLIKGPLFTDLVDSGYLAPLRYFIAGKPDLSKVKLQNGDYNLEQAEQAMNNVPLIESYGDHCRGMSGVVFAVNIHHSRNIVDRYNAVGVRAAHLDAQTHPAERQRILKLFREKLIDIVSNVGIITEGFDFPDLQFVQLARPTLSLALFLQMIGRVTRTDYEAIKDALNDEHRRTLVSLSKKPYGIVLDNAGLYKTHGMPDQPFDWDIYFQGVERKKKKDHALIEVITFVAEDEDGKRVSTKFPDEVDGLKLIEVTRSIQERAITITSLKEFDKLSAMFKNFPKVQKKGFAVLNNFIDFCRKQNSDMTPDVWDYIVNKLWTETQDAQASELSKLDQAISVIQMQYAHDPIEQKAMIDSVTQNANKRAASIKSMEVPIGYIRKLQKEYNEKKKARTALAGNFGNK
jgi:superfamily II DNA or RNA helicase